MLEKTRSAQSMSADDADKSASANETDSTPRTPSPKPSKPNSPKSNTLKKNAVIIQYAYAGVGEDEFDEGVSARHSGATTIYGYDSEDIA